MSDEERIMYEMENAEEEIESLESQLAEKDREILQSRQIEEGLDNCIKEYEDKISALEAVVSEAIYLLRLPDYDDSRGIQLGIFFGNPVGSEAVRKAKEKDRALAEIYRAISNPGVNPEFHADMISSLMARWPVLWKAIEHARKALGRE